MAVAGRTIPRNAVVVGTGKIQGERLDIEITSLEYDGTIIPVELAVYDTDGQPGIFIPNSMEMNAVREVAANMGGSLGSSINISTNAGAQLASDLGKGLIQGTSQYIAKKMRTVKVHLKPGTGSCSIRKRTENNNQSKKTFTTKNPKSNEKSNHHVCPSLWASQLPTRRRM